VRLFVDNDILLKLASAGLLKNLNNIFSVDDSSIFVLPTAKNYISKSKKVKHKYSKIPDEYIDNDLFLRLSDIDEIDSGEQILFSIKSAINDFLILTGDKKAIRQLYSHNELIEIASGLKNKIVCLECLFLKLMEQHNFEEFAESIRESNYCGDKTIELVFQQNILTFALARDGLLSNFNNLNNQTNNFLFK
jgi:hypothetical protein